MNKKADPVEGHWQGDVFRVLKEHDIKHIVYVPDAGHSTAIRLAEADNEIDSVVLTTEEEGIGYLAGAWLGGERGALLMQSSGVGNCINTLALQVCARFPLLMVVTMRGDWAEFNGWQNPMGQATEKALNLMGVLTWRADAAGGCRAAPAWRGDDGLQWRRGLRCAPGAAAHRRKAMGEVTSGGPLDRREAVSRLLADRKDLLVVTGLGSSSYDVMAAGDHDNNYYLWAAMGSAATVGLGLASAQPGRSVLVVTGDGEMMMGLRCARHHRGAQACQSDDRRSRQRSFRRDRHAAQPCGPWHRDRSRRREPRFFVEQG